MNKSVLLFVAILYTIVLTVLNFVSISKVPDLGLSFNDKIFHLGAYFGLAFLWLTYFKFFNKKSRFFVVSVFLVLYGVTLELLQHRLNPNRTYEVYDLSANCLGVIIGMLFVYNFNVLKLK